MESWHSKWFTFDNVKLNAEYIKQQRLFIASHTFMAIPTVKHTLQIDSDDNRYEKNWQVGLVFKLDHLPCCSGWDFLKHCLSTRWESQMSQSVSFWTFKLERALWSLSFLRAFTKKINGVPSRLLFSSCWTRSILIFRAFDFPPIII